jgi:Clp amino terminal domain, pathogenicity island component/UvrB/uvrC motif
MYERFTDRARKIMQLANLEAQRFNHGYIGTEHILLGLIKEGSGVAANVLKNLNTDLRKIRLEVEKIVLPAPDEARSGKLPLTPRVKKVIEYAIEEARNLGHNYVGSEHLLLGLVREEEGVAAQVLLNLGLKLSTVRQEVLSLLGHNLQEKDEPVPLTGDESSVQDLVMPGPLGAALAELDSQLRALTRAKEEAVAEQDFERAAHLRDQTDRLTRQREDLAKQAKRVERVQEYELYVPLRDSDGVLVEPEKLERVRGWLTKRFGGVAVFHQRIDGEWKIGNVALRDEVAIYRVLSRDAPESTLFFMQLREELKTELRQDDFLILVREANVL